MPTDDIKKNALERAREVLGATLVEQSAWERQEIMEVAAAILKAQVDILEALAKQDDASWVKALIERRVKYLRAAASELRKEATDAN